VSGWISAKSIAEQLGISHEQVGSIIHEDLDMIVAYFLPGWAKDLSAPLYTNIPGHRSGEIAQVSEKSPKYTVGTD
jgi:hypothetical protein